MISIEYYDENIEIPENNPEFFISVIPKIIELEKKVCGDINIIFCSDNYLLEMNKTYLNHDYFTDIITFDYSDNQLVSGDLFVSYERVQDNCSLYQVSYGYELSRVVFHGVLHLLGYNDKETLEKSIMSRKEDEYLSLFVSRETRRC
jgi:probable rRNA maturation factor